jgi:hypothetical protein
MEAKKPAKESGRLMIRRRTQILNHIKAINKAIEKLKQNIDVVNLKRNQPSKDNEGFTIVGLDQENIKLLKILKIYCQSLLLTTSS